MNFYGIDYLESQANFNDYIKYVLIFGSLFILVIVFVRYLKHRIQTKYRDLSIIFLLVLIFALGVQYSDYQSNQAKQSQSSQMVAFIKSVAKERGVDQKEIFVNGTQLNDGVLLKIKDQYYRVNLALDQGSYTLNRAHVLSEKIMLTE
ncbi:MULTISPECIES: DUF3290 domain-containing protein [Enterococcus]|uniref:DUF3290 domain-containing protein n=1 Tax=Enterococcus diestrammenae TaxID=1155073 RepID=A0ABV0F2T0_9ENTE|nr:DUF3290 domain-containing protein [Enterococcus diestrammenae]KAF1299776.1 hypothetical protein BAU18_07580 [Enterococcus diestrammenae]